MHCVNIVFILVVVAMATASPTGKVHYDVRNAPALFEQFIKDYNRHYKDAADKYVHYNAFVASLIKINEMNAHTTGATYGITDFADYTEEEMKKKKGLIYNKNNN